MACAFLETTCNVGVIVGTGSNACYMEKLDKILKLKGIVDPNGKNELDLYYPLLTNLN